MIFLIVLVLGVVLGFAGQETKRARRRSENENENDNGKSERATQSRMFLCSRPNRWFCGWQIELIWLLYRILR